MNKVYLKHKKTSFSKIYYFSILPLIIYALYKNGIILYLRKYISLINIFKPVLFTISSFIVLLIINLIKEKKIGLMLDDYKWLFITLFLPLNTNYLIFIVLIFIFITADKDIKSKYINLSVFFKLLLILILYLLNSYNYQNIMEATASFNYNSLDFFMGREVGGLGATSYFYIFLTYIILSTNIYYKKTIPFVSTITFIGLLIILSIFFPNLITISNLGSVLLVYVVLATDFKYSPYIIKAQIIYSLLLAVLTILFSVITNIYEGVFIALLITSVLSPFLDKLFERQNKTK